MTPSAYVDLIETRFANPAIHDTTRRVAFDGSSRHMGFVLPILRDALDAGGPISGLSLVEALWARMCAGAREDGTSIAPNDPQWEALSAMALKARENPECWIGQAKIYGDLAKDARFSTEFTKWLTLIWSQGTVAAIDAYVSGT